MRTRWGSRRKLWDTWLLAVAVAALATSKTAAAMALVVANGPPQMWLLCDEQRTRCEWPVVAASRQFALSTERGGSEYRLRRPLLDQWPQPSPFSAGWKRHYDGGSRPRRLFVDSHKRARYAFSSWGGKWLPVARSDAARVTLDAQQSQLLSSTFPGWAAKRSQRFFNWGGKRSLTDNELRRITDAAVSEVTTTTKTIVAQLP